MRPTSLSIGKYPVALVGLLGNTSFFGSQNDALGFDSFFETGLALELAVSASGWKLKILRFGAKAILGSDVNGWSLIFGYGT